MHALFEVEVASAAFRRRRALNPQIAILDCGDAAESVPAAFEGQNQYVSAGIGKVGPVQVRIIAVFEMLPRQSAATRVVSTSSLVPSSILCRNFAESL